MTYNECEVKPPRWDHVNKYCDWTLYGFTVKNGVYCTLIGATCRSKTPPRVYSKGVYVPSRV